MCPRHNPAGNTLRPFKLFEIPAAGETDAGGARYSAAGRFAAEVAQVLEGFLGFLATCRGALVSNQEGALVDFVKQHNFYWSGTREVRWMPALVAILGLQPRKTPLVVHERNRPALNALLAGIGVGAQYDEDSGKNDTFRSGVFTPHLPDDTVDFDD